MDQENRSGALFAAGRLADAQSLPLRATNAYRSPISPKLIQHTRVTEHLMHNWPSPWPSPATVVLAEQIRVQFRPRCEDLVHNPFIEHMSLCDAFEICWKKRKKKWLRT